MEMDEDFLEAHDLDFFAYFEDGLLGHFATAGQGFVPELVKSSIENYERVYDYVDSLGENFGFKVIDRNVPEFNATAQRDRYLKSFSIMAKKGFFSYDYRGDRYQLIVAPQIGRRISEVPSDIGSALAALSLSTSENIELISSNFFKLDLN
ncbi:hypothetical protein HU720_09935 [Pseudomonas sp. SWRI51]|uniref:hypothetical protein n=1 Tax=Pseudomonas sp. SWRI51 TaxID=2745491 RepID=UPI0016453D3B|nr:hypothetical protein [Pseudomonas sp. SWRI51]MBC3411621.1 hypothetical protein [Pseudomonas sp. SWRI51]